MATLLLLALWLQNEDRSLSAAGGNPNLLVTQISAISAISASDSASELWSAQPKRAMLWAFDFNLAFDDGFERGRFFNSHVFGGVMQQWPQGFRERMETKMMQAMELLPQWFAELPDEWRYLDGDDTLPVQLAEECVSSALRLPFTESDAFWSLP